MQFCALKQTVYSMGQSREALLQQIDSKFKTLKQSTDVHLEGLLHATPITYWDYIHTDALLNLQIQRTSLPDEMVFIMYHQINELLFKMILWEIGQVTDESDNSPELFAMRLGRISRYFDVLSSSFSVMGDGMEPEQYMKFRNTLTPASGFQSAQYRKIELASTELVNLIDARFRSTYKLTSSLEESFELLYWQAAGKDHLTGEKSLLLKLFEKRYKSEFLTFMQHAKSKNLWTVFKALPGTVKANKTLLNAMRHFDHTVNVRWVMAHYNAAAKYLDSGTETKEATGGSDWKKYMHPKYQRRIFFPELWSEDELSQWGIDNLTSYESL